MSIQSAFEEEARRLRTVSEEIQRQLDGIGPRYYGDDFTERMLDLQREKRRQLLQRIEKEPHFGRLDFQERSQGTVSPIYIGKNGLEREGSHELLVVDWRAPISSLFYSFTGGDEPVSYTAPEGEVSGTIHRKRNMVIRQKELQRVVDSYVKGADNVSVSDEFLLYRLSENKDNRLRDIVSTIQQEQDRIIRSPRNTALFIQGVAGSGKTTVALHRLAYLLYQYQDSMQSDKMIIFAPNRMFLDYISDVLPELGVGHIQQTTFEEWALAQLGAEVSLTDPAKAYESWFSITARCPIDDRSPGRWKGSLQFRAQIEEALSAYEAALTPKDDFIPWDGEVLPAETIRGWMLGDYGHYPLIPRRERLFGRMKRWVEMAWDRHPEKSWNKSRKQQAMTKLRAWFKKLPEHTALSLYRQIIAGDWTFANGTLADEASAVQTSASGMHAGDKCAGGNSANGIPPSLLKASARKLARKQVDIEDLAPLLYIHIRLNGLGKVRFDHVVIDEAQDYSPFQLAVLKEFQREASFTVLGDLQQGIHAYRGIESWDEMIRLFPEPGQTAYFELDRSYRSTTEIIEFAGRVLSGLNIPVKQAVPVFRSGDPVELVRIEPAERQAVVERAVRDWLREAHIHTGAVITRTEQESVELHGKLSELGLPCTLIQAKEQVYQGGISILPVFLAKGLEFDAVLIVDADETHYTSCPMDAKLLYVGCTRALHRLKLVYSGEPTPLVRTN